MGVPESFMTVSSAFMVLKKVAYDSFLHNFFDQLIELKVLYLYLVASMNSKVYYKSKNN
jgi:hypothetical protein